jgi:hypothetical protein
MARSWMLLLVGVIGLVSLRAAYDLTWEPAPAVRVRWRQGTTDARRAQLERRYRLVNPQPHEGVSYLYLLMDTSRRNIEALVKDPEVADTDDIDRRRFEIPWTAAQSRVRNLWVADRLPGLRQPFVRVIAIAILAGMTAFGLISVLVAIDWRGHGRRLLAWMRRVDWILKHG